MSGFLLGNRPVETNVEMRGCHPQPLSAGTSHPRPVAPGHAAPTAQLMFPPKEIQHTGGGPHRLPEPPGRQVSLPKWSHPKMK